MSPYYLSYEKSYDHKLIKRESLTLLIQEHQAFFVKDIILSVI